MSHGDVCEEQLGPRNEHHKSVLMIWCGKLHWRDKTFSSGQKWESEGEGKREVRRDVNELVWEREEIHLYFATYLKK